MKNWITSRMGGKQVGRILSVSFFSLVIDLITKSSRAVVFILVARILGPSESGVFAVALSYQAIFQAFTLSGVDFLIIREVAKDNSKAADYFNHIALIRVALFVVAYSFLLLTVHFLYSHRPITKGVILLLGLAILPESLGELCRAFFVAHGRLRFPASIAALLGILKVTVVYRLLEQGAHLKEIAGAVVIFSGLSALGNMIYIYRYYLKERPAFHWTFLRGIISNLSAFAGMGILRVLEYNTTILMLSFLGGEQQTGIYNASYTLILAILMLPQAYANGILPELSQLYAQSRHEELIVFFKKCFRGLTVILLPILLVLFLAAPLIVPALFSSSYHESIAVFRVLLPVILFTFLSTPQIVSLLALNRQNSVVGIVWASILISIAGGVVAIPMYGALGAATSRVFATCSITLLSYLVSLKVLSSLTGRQTKKVFDWPKG